MRPSLLALALVVPLAAQAEPLQLTHQGLLLGSNDAPIDAAGLSLTFRLYTTLKEGDSAERLVWESSPCNVNVQGGRYSVVLGGACNGATPLGTEHLSTNEARFLEISVEGDRLLPRLAITPSPLAASARNADKVGGLDLAGLDARFDAKYAPIAGSASGGYVVLNPAAPQTGGLEVSGAVKAGSVAAATISASGGVTAEEFIGSGARLTQIDANALTGILPGARLSGAYPGAITFSNAQNVFAGDGAGLLNVNAAKIGGLALDDLDARYARVSGGTGGAVSFGSAVKIANGGTTCDEATAGTIRWDGANFLGCDGTGWRQLNNQPPPVVNTALPATVLGTGGTPVTITGSHFVTGATVFIGGAAATNVSVVSATRITATAPAGSGGGKEVRVVNPDGQAGILTGAVTYFDPVFNYLGIHQTFVVPAGVTQVTVRMWGAGGGGGRTANVKGGSGGYTTGKLNVNPGEVYTVVVGQGGSRIVSGNAGGGAGGGLSGLFLGNPSQATAKLIAGGGGGAGYYESTGGGSSGGNGGGLTGGDGSASDASHYSSRGRGGTQSAGGDGGIYSGGWAGANGIALQGGGGGNGNNSGSGGAGGATYGGGGAVGLGAGTAQPYGTGGGGGGYWGGGGGSNNAPLGGGGGSGFVAAGVLEGSTVGTTTFGQPAGTTDPFYATGIAWGGYALNSAIDSGGNGRVVITW